MQLCMCLPYEIIEADTEINFSAIMILSVLFVSVWESVAPNISLCTLGGLITKPQTCAQTFGDQNLKEKRSNP